MMYTVGEMANILGVPASTLQYYDKTKAGFRGKDAFHAEYIGCTGI